MAQLPHFRATAQAADITSGLAAGCYLAQVAGGPDLASHVAHPIIYATAATPPADLNDWFRAAGSAAFTFVAGNGATPTWVRISPEWIEYD